MRSDEQPHSIASYGLGFKPSRPRRSASEQLERQPRTAQPLQLDGTAMWIPAAAAAAASSAASLVAGGASYSRRLYPAARPRWSECRAAQATAERCRVGVGPASGGHSVGASMTTSCAWLRPDLRMHSFRASVILRVALLAAVLVGQSVALPCTPSEGRRSRRTWYVVPAGLRARTRALRPEP